MAPPAFASIIVASIISSRAAVPGDHCHSINNQVDAVNRLAIAIIAGLANAASDVHQVVLSHLGGALDILAETGDAVPAGIVLPIIANLAAVVCCNVQRCHLFLDLRAANAADDAKFSDVLHVCSFVLSLLTHFGGAALLTRAS